MLMLVYGIERSPSQESSGGIDLFKCLLSKKPQNRGIEVMVPRKHRGRCK